MITRAFIYSYNTCHRSQTIYASYAPYFRLPPLNISKAPKQLSLIPINNGSNNYFKNTNTKLSISDVTHVVVIFSEDQVRAIMEAIGVEYEASFTQPSWDYITLAASKCLFDGQALLQTNTLGSKSIGKTMCFNSYI